MITTPEPGERSDEAARDFNPADILAAKAASRAKAIDALVAQAKADGNYASRAFWAMVYDFEKAPKTTNRRQLCELGIELPVGDAVDRLSEAEIASTLRRTFDGLAVLGIYLLHTDHLSDRELLRKLVEEVLDEEVPDAAGSDCQEWIDLMALDAADVAAIRDEFYPESADAPVSPRSARRDATLPRPRVDSMRTRDGGGGS